MKVAVLSDIHGNLPALQTTTEHIEKWQPDLVVVAGDVVNRGPSSLDCWRFVVEKQQTAAWHITHGNHEGYILEHQGATAVLDLLLQPSYWTYQQLRKQIDNMRQLPPHLSFTAPDDSQIRITHASMRGSRDGISPHSADELLRQQIAPAPAIFCTAHTHRPFLRSIDNTLVVNAGSVGTPGDGDVRASYAQVTWHNGRWQANIIRLDYDREQAKQDYHNAGYFEGCGPMGCLIYIEWLTARFHIYPWLHQYETAVRNNEIDLATAVAQFLNN